MNRSLKIAEVCWQFGGHQEGISRAVTELSVRLSRQHDVHVFAHAFYGTETKSLHFKKVPVPPRMGWFWALGFSFNSGKMLSKERFDVVHLHVPCFADAQFVSCHIFPRVMLKWVKSLKGQAKRWLTPMQRLRAAVFALHEPLYRHNFKKQERRFIAVSTKVKRELIAEYGLGDARVNVVPLGVDLELFAPGNRDRFRQDIRHRHGIADDAYLFLFVGQNFLGKGLQYIIEVLPQLRHPCRLLIVGSGEGTERYIHFQIDRLGLRHAVAFAGNQQVIAPFYAAADAFVSFSPYESFGLAVLEAMASGLPVIGTPEIGLLDELKEQGLGDVVLTVSGQDSLRYAMDSLISDPEASKALGRKARSVAESYTWDRHVERMDALYRDAACCRQ